MLNRKRMGGKIKGCRERGEWAELYFMMLALEKDMKVSRPFGLAGRYDVGVESAGEQQRGGAGAGEVDDLQAAGGDGYSLNVMGPKRKKYVTGDGGFFCHPADTD